MYFSSTKSLIKMYRNIVCGHSILIEQLFDDEVLVNFQDALPYPLSRWDMYWMMNLYLMGFKTKNVKWKGTICCFWFVQFECLGLQAFAFTPIAPSLPGA